VAHEISSPWRRNAVDAITAVGNMAEPVRA
jgi:hypothetical protein